MRRDVPGSRNSRCAGVMLAWICVTAVGGFEARAEFALLGPVKDGTLIENPSGALSNGSGPSLFAGRTSAASGSIRRALIQFDVSGAVPPGSTVTGAVLWLNLSSTNGGESPVILTRILADWGEGASSSSGGGGAPSVQGDSTWIHRSYDAVFWDRPGGDFDPLPRAATPVDQPRWYSWGPTPDTVEDVQSWLDHPETNHGWLLLGDEAHPTSAKRFDSREHPEATSRPVLRIDFVPPCRPDPLGPGTWMRQCSEPTMPGFADWVLPCANQVLADLDLAAGDACEALLADAPLSCAERAIWKLSVLVLNVCAGRLQTSCPMPSDDGACSSTRVGDLLEEISRLIGTGDCRRASGCVPD